MKKYGHFKEFSALVEPERVARRVLGWNFHRRFKSAALDRGPLDYAGLTTDDLLPDIISE